MSVYNYPIKLELKGGKQAILKANEGDELAVATPHEFGGPGGYWTPEDLLVGSVVSCVMSTFLFFVEKKGVILNKYESHAQGRMEKTVTGLRFTGVSVQICVEVSDPKDMEWICGLKEKLEKFCPVSASLNCPVELDIQT